MTAEANQSTPPVRVTASTPRPIRLAYVVSHPIQYQAGMLRRIAADPAIDLTVFFCSDFSTRTYRDAGFGVAVDWDVPLTEGYRHVFLPRWRDTHDPGALKPISRGFLRSFQRGPERRPFDALWVHGYSTANALHAILAARLLGIPVLLRAEPWLRDRQRSPIKLLLKRLAMSGLRSLIAAALPIGTRNAAYWSYYFGEDFPLFLMPYAVDNAFFAAGAEAAAHTRGTLAEELLLEPGRPVILFASKLQERKHCDHLLQAYCHLCDRSDENSCPHLLIVGDGDQMTALRSQAGAAQRGKYVRFAGFRNQRELPRFFDLASVFVLPSRHEPWGLIVNEAMASGCAVIVSDEVGCAADLVRNGENGFVYRFGDVAALSQALECVLQPGQAEAMGQRSREMIHRWSYDEDLAGLKRALQHVTRLPLPNPAEGAHATGAL